MKIIDAHQHFWKFDAVRDGWINDDMKLLQRDFLPEDLKPLLASNSVDGCVVIQSDQSEKENIFQLENAQNFEFVKGVVGWVDLEAKNVEERLSQYGQFAKMKGFRHILQGELARDKMLQPAFMRGIGFLKKHNYTYDILIFPDQLQYLPKFLAAFPNQKFVIDHIAKPNIRGREIDLWKEQLVKIAQFENVQCKISGMVTEADWRLWLPDDFTPYLDVIVENFGTDRIMFGSDWPVCLVAASYKKTLNIVQRYFSKFSNIEQNQFFSLNAVKFYSL